MCLQEGRGARRHKFNLLRKNILHPCALVSSRRLVVIAGRLGRGYSSAVTTLGPGHFCATASVARAIHRPDCKFACISASNFKLGAKEVLGQVVPKPEGGRPESGIGAAARQLPIPGHTEEAKRRPMQVFGLPRHLIRSAGAASRLLAAETPNIEAERRRDAVVRWLKARAAGLTAERAAQAVGCRVPRLTVGASAPCPARGGPNAYAAQTVRRA